MNAAIWAGGGVAGEDLAHRRRGGRRRQVSAVGQLGEDGLPAAEVIQCRHSGSSSRRPPIGAGPGDPAARSVRSGGATALADDPPALTLGGTAPHAFLLAEPEGVLEARLADGAHGADGLGRLGVDVVVAEGVEDRGIEALAGGFARQVWLVWVVEAIIRAASLLGTGWWLERRVCRVPRRHVQTTWRPPGHRIGTTGRRGTDRRWSISRPRAGRRAARRRCRARGPSRGRTRGGRPPGRPARPRTRSTWSGVSAKWT